jgi:hypothetical protein
MTKEFNKWWNEDLLSQDNPYVDGTAAFWAWEGWQAALAQPEQELVAWTTQARCLVPASEFTKAEATLFGWQALYTTPPAAQRTWVGLTDDEIVLVIADCAASHQHMDIHLSRAIEAKLRSKNEHV